MQNKKYQYTIGKFRRLIHDCESQSLSASLPAPATAASIPLFAHAHIHNIFELKKCQK